LSGVRRRAFVVLGVALVSLAAAASAQAADGSISGTVTSISNAGAAVANYQVDLFDSSKAMVDSTCTGGDGTYRFANVPGTYYVEFAGLGTKCAPQTAFAPEWYDTPQNTFVEEFAAPVTVTDGANTPNIDASLTDAATIEGTVTAGGVPVAGIDVKVLDDHSAVVGSACTGADGKYAVHNLVPLFFDVEFEADGNCAGGPIGTYEIQYWQGQSTPAGANLIILSAGQDQTGIDAQLASGTNWLLTVGSDGTGSGSVTSSPLGIDCPGGPCLNVFDGGSQVTLTATPAAGSQFTGWTGGGCGTDPTCTVTMNSDLTVTATFGPAVVVKHTLAVAPAGTGSGNITSSSGGISCPGSCSASLDSGTQVTLTATASAGSTFAGWSGGGCSGTGTCVVTLSSDQSITATFAPASTSPLTASLTVNRAGNGSGHVHASAGPISCPGTCSETVGLGATVTLTATPDAGSKFTGWSGGGCSGTASCTVTIRSPTSVTATFAKTTTTGPPAKASCFLAIVSALVTPAGARGGGKSRPPSLTLRYSCSASAAVTISGAVTERLPHHKTKTFHLKPIHASVGIGRENTVVVKLPGAVVAGLRKHRRESAAFVLVARSTGGSSRSKATVGRLRS
jgi:uncharacterized repeat protein (TIGR02543 family)